MIFNAFIFNHDNFTCDFITFKLLPEVSCFFSICADKVIFKQTKKSQIQCYLNLKNSHRPYIFSFLVVVLKTHINFYLAAYYGYVIWKPEMMASGKWREKKKFWHIYQHLTLNQQHISCCEGSNDKEMKYLSPK